MSDSPERLNSKEVRAWVQARRRALSSSEIARLSQSIVGRFNQNAQNLHPWSGRLVGLYRAFPGEVDLRSLESTLTSFGARLCFPRVLDRQKVLMEFALDPGMDPSWPSGPFGIREPPAHCPAVDPSEIDVIFVPGAAFGLQGERVGMGAGFNDRYLPLAPQALRIALAFDFQLLPKLEQSPWDQSVHWILTERREIRLREPLFPPS